MGATSEFECRGGQGDANNYAAVVYLYAADMVLEQGSGPSASGVSGELASAAAVSGTSDVAFGASDPGSGVYEAVISLDGEVVQSTVLDEDGGRCRNVGGTSDGLAAFLYVQPCPPSLSADVGLDTTRFANGSHHLVVSVVDAAGNSATVLDRNITIANPTSAGSAGSAGAGSAAGAAGAGTGAVGAANGTNASAQATLTAGWKGAKGSRLVSGYGRTETIAGRLTAPGGVPIGGAQIEVLATPAYTGARAVAMAGPHTAADGDFSLRIPAGASSRSLRLAYHSRLGEPAVAAARTLTLSVHAALALKISPDGERGTADLLQRASARRPGPGRRQAAGTGGQLSGLVDRVQRDPQRRPRPLPRELPLPLPGARELPVPGGLGGRGRLSIRDRGLERGGGAGGMTPRPGSSVRPVD